MQGKSILHLSESWAPSHLPAPHQGLLSTMDKLIPSSVSFFLSSYIENFLLVPVQAVPSSTEPQSQLHLFSSACNVSNNKNTAPKELWPHKTAELWWHSSSKTILFRIALFFLVSHSLELWLNLILLLQAEVSGVWMQIASALHALLLLFHCFRIQSLSQRQGPRMLLVSLGRTRCCQPVG